MNRFDPIPPPSAAAHHLKNPTFTEEETPSRRKA
jgi:hypothetical protein